MRFPTFILALFLTFGSLFTPFKKAEASLLIVNPVVFLVGFSLSTASIIPFITSYDEIRGGAYDRAFNLLWFSLFSISVLDQDLDKMGEALEKEFPTIPRYVLNEASLLMKEKANFVEFNNRGFKSVTMSLEEFSDLELSMADVADPKEVAALKRLLTTPEL
jgi:hypothetical protein